MTSIYEEPEIFTPKQVEDLVDLLVSLDTSTKVYLGCDSVRFGKEGKMYARYAVVCIVHKNGNNGCKIFSQKFVERDYDAKANKPRMRMLSEVHKVCELYRQLKPIIDGYDVEIHLDISTDPKNGSNCAATEAAGFVLGMTGVVPMLKPDSWASSFGADHVANKSIAA